jgi:predicted  nucleic acid-binding Zn-ribbon protein
VASVILAEISVGELIDKITILEIKRANSTAGDRRSNIETELEALERSRDAHVPLSEELTRLTAELRSVNEALWRIEDDIRECERAKDFGARFVQLARSVYITNDRRAALKREINELLGSRIVEEKLYASY